jgi:hypothetical protein
MPHSELFLRSSFFSPEHPIYMQFGRTFGLALVVLGILLFGFQAVLVVTPRKNSQATGVTANAEHRTNPLPGIVGAGSLIIGIAMLTTARRKDEPEPKHAVK